MKNFFFVIFLIFNSIMVNSQRTIIVGPQNDCNTKGIHKNIHTSSAFLELGNSNSIKITTHQHRTLDASRIYNESGQLIWEWKGESRSETWYTKEHYLTVNSSRIKVEFYQGYSDPFCNGFIKVEVLNQKNDVPTYQSPPPLNTQNNSPSQTEKTQNYTIEPKISELNLSYQEFSKALNLFYFAYKSKMTISSSAFDPMKILLRRGLKQFNYPDAKDQAIIDIMIGKVTGGPSSYGQDSDWRLNNNYRNSLDRFYLDYNTIFNDFSNEVNSQLSDDCNTCNDLIKEYYNYFKNKTIVPESEFNSLKIKVERCKNQQYDDLKGKTKKYLAILTNQKEGGPRYGEDEKYKFIGFAYRDPIKILESHVLNSKDLLVKTTNGFGVTDDQGFLFIKDRYDSISVIYFKGEFFFLVTKDDKTNVIAWDGSIVKDVEFEQIISSENNRFIYVKKDGAWYLINEKSFNTQATDFENVVSKYELFIVTKNGKFGILNRQGSVNGSISFDEIKAVPFNSSIILIKSKDKWAVIPKDKVNLTPIEDDQFKYSRTEFLNAEKLILVSNNNLIGFFDESGKLLFDTEYLNYKFDERNRVFMQTKTGWGVYDLTTGQQISETIFQNIERFSNKDYYLVRTHNKYGLIDQSGKIILEPSFDKLYEIQYDSEFNDTFLVVSIGAKFGSVSIDKIDIDKIHYVPVQFLSINNVENEWIKNKNTLYNRRLEEQNRIRQEQERQRLAEEKRIYEEQLNYCKNKVIAFETFARDYSNYVRGTLNGSIYPNPSEFMRWQNDVSRQLSKIEDCGDSEYNSRITDAMRSIQSTAMGIPGITNNSSSRSTSNQSSYSSKVSNSTKSTSHSYNVSISWNNPVSAAEYPNRPDVSNGYVDYFYAKSSSYKVQPVCPVCGKKSSQTISGFSAGKGQKSTKINCMGN